MTLADLLRRQTVPFVLTFFIALAGSARVQGQVYSDQQLVELARTTYERAKAGQESDWQYAALHINALIQRNPPAVQNSPTFARQLAEGLTHAGNRITAWYQAYGQRAAAPTRAADPSEPASSRSGLSTKPLTITWP
jgi:hypothetical protein